MSDMQTDSISQYFIGSGVKRVTGTEVDPKVSNGHEFQGVDSFRAFLGTPDQKTKVPIKWVWLSDDEPPLVVSHSGTWYNSRRGQPHREPEYRLYYPAAAEEVIYRAKPEDSLFICMPRDSTSLLALLCQRGSSIEQQLLWLFSLSIGGQDLVQKDLRLDQGRAMDMATRYILELIDVEVIVSDDRWLDLLLRKFPKGLPPTRKLSELAREHAKDVDPLNDPDQTLLTWMDLEERLFMTYEKHLLGDRLREGFIRDDVVQVEDFISYSLHVLNRRKSRAGFALGNHVEALLEINGVRHKREATTEKRNGPDFLFPGEAEYHDVSWSQDKLLILAVKTSCKDRWRQVLSEADRIPRKHLLTLEPGISKRQTDEMRKENLQLVLPRPLHDSYSLLQQPELATFSDFIHLTRSLL
ncbi:type II restriction endonuclease [Pseudomonas caspiana]|uniref:type II restriction endonuclease n=1 Tax=Pseudomonas caspiana TaxID=1451454 RepID=UPI0032ED486C